MSSTCFDSEDSSSGRRMCIQLRSGTFYIHQKKQPSGWMGGVRTHSSTYQTAKHVDDMKKKLKITILIY